MNESIPNGYMYSQHKLIIYITAILSLVWVLSWWTGHEYNYRLKQSEYQHESEQEQRAVRALEVTEMLERTREIASRRR